MIRINLLGQTRPKAARRTADTGAALPLVFIAAGLLLGGLFLFYFYHSWQTQLADENKRIKTLTAQKTELEQIKLQVEAFEKLEERQLAAFKVSEFQAELRETDDHSSARYRR